MTPTPTTPTTPFANTVAPTGNGTTVTIDTSSTVAVMKTLRRLLLDYRNPSGWSARQYLGERLFDTRSRDAPLQFPYAVMRLETRNMGMNHGQRLEGDFEVQVHGRPWTQQEQVDGIADLFDQCMLALLVNQTGLIICYGWQRAMLPTGPDPIDSEVVTVRLVYTLGIWPQFLTKISYILPPETAGLVSTAAR